MSSRILRVLLVVCGGVLLAIAIDGPDFGHYIDWANTAVSGDIFELRGDILSPRRVPYNLWSFEPGLLFGITQSALGAVTVAAVPAHVTGWLAALLFWASAIALLHHVGKGDRATTMLGAAALFVGTPVGVYSHAYASEVFGDAFIAAVWALAICRRPWRLSDCAAAGALLALMFLVRPYLVLYAVPALWAGLDDRRQPIKRAALLVGPLLIAGVQQAIVNRWMTGAPWHLPYLFGDGAFRSVDLWHPHVAAVLLHPFHGLLPYHPLYGLAFLALLVEIMVDPERRVFWTLTLVAVLAHLWVQSGWFTWWLGTGTFGMRGMAAAALPLVAALVARIRRQPVGWVALTVLLCLWSFPLMLDPPVLAADWHSFLSAQQPASVAVAAGTAVIALTLVAAAVMRSRNLAVRALGDVSLAAWTTGALTVGYLGWQLFHVPNGLAAAGLAAAGITITALAVSAGRYLTQPRVTALVAVAVFAAQALLFARLAVATDRYLASGAPPPRPFLYRSVAPIDELRDTLAEYQRVKGFDTPKAELRGFLDREAMKAPIMDPLDRSVANQVRTVLAADPLLSGVQIYVTAQSGVVALFSSDTTRTQRERAIALAEQVPNVVRVEDGMR